MIPSYRVVMAALLGGVSFCSWARAVDPADLKPGLIASYADGERKICRLEPAVGLTLAQGESAHPQLGPLTSATWQGYLIIVRTGKYRFSVTSHGGPVQLQMDQQVILTAPASESAVTTTSQVLELTGGVKPFSVSIQSDGRPARIELCWEGPGFRREPIPHMFFGHLPKDRPSSFQHDLGIELGRFRFEELGCIQCHRPREKNPLLRMLVDRPAPHLTDVGKRVYPGWLDAWLADPKRIRPHATMPKLFTDDDRGRAERYAVTSFLVSQGGPLSPNQPPTFSKDYAKSQENGRVLFGTIGCTACHQEPLPKKPRREDFDEDKLPLEAEDYLYGLGTSAGPAGKYLLGALGSKTRPEVLAAFLNDPLKTHPAGRMPRFSFSGNQALDIARFLCKTTDDAISPAMPQPPPMHQPEDLLPEGRPQGWDKLSLEKKWVEAGRRIVLSKGCVNCHELTSGGAKLPPSESFPPLETIRQSGKPGCLGSPTGVAPRYQWDVREADAIRLFLKDGLEGAGSPSPMHAARLTLKRLNCLNCHQRDGEGGLPPELLDQMKGLQKAEDNEDLRPPVLTGIGHKALTSWLRGVLTQGQRARPWMPLQMPQYAVNHVGHLAISLASLEGAVPQETADKIPLTPELIAAGRQIVGKSGLGCISCHDIAGVPNSGTRGPDLATIDQRVRYDWYERWLSQPLRMSPGTRMPQAFIDGKSPLTAVLEGDAERQARAMWAYLSLGPALPLPEGMEPPKGLTLVVKDRPEILRTFLPECTTRSIAVGYPGGVSLAFSADECRVVYAWAGNFVDATPVWDARGGRPAKLLGPKFWTAPPGHPWGLSPPDALPPDFDARAGDPGFGIPLPFEPPRLYTGPRHTRFDGYSTDAAGFPRFQYRLVEDASKSLTVMETPEPLKSGVATGLKRSFTLQPPPDRQIWFQAGITSAAPRAISRTGQTIPLDLQAAPLVLSTASTRLILPADGQRVYLLDATAPDGTAWYLTPRKDQRWTALVKLAPGATSLVLEVWALPKDDVVLIQSLPAK